MKNVQLLDHSSAAYRLMWGSIDQMFSFFYSFLLPGSLYAYWELPHWRWEVNLPCIFCKRYLSQRSYCKLYTETFYGLQISLWLQCTMLPLWSGEGDSLQFPDWTGNYYGAAVSSFTATVAHDSYQVTGHRSLQSWCNSHAADYTQTITCGTGD